MKGHKVWLKPKALWAYKQARWKTCCWGIFCSRFHSILSPLKLILEMVFWTNLMLDLICTWLEKTRRFCRQVNKKISSCFWTASTCVQEFIKMMFTVDLCGNRGLDSRSWLYYYLVLSRCLILPCFCWVLTQTTLAENWDENYKEGIETSFKTYRSSVSAIVHWPLLL